MTAIEQIKEKSESFYVTGGTLRRDAPCYVQRKADEELFDGLMQGQFCYVLTSRQMGKSSLMVRTAARLRETGTSVVVLDLTSVGQNLNAEQWYDGLLSRVGQQLHLEDELEAFWINHQRLSPLQRFMDAIRTVVLSSPADKNAGRIVFFVDEIDAVRSLPFSTDEFFAAIRECYNRRTEDTELERLTFCLLGVATPSDLIRDTRTTPFNIGRRIELNDFIEAEAAPLARGLQRDEKTVAKLLKRILYWTGGHPYLTQRLCQAVAEDASVKDAAGVDRLCEELFFTTRARERDDNLLFVRERMLKSEADVAALLDLYKKIRNQRRVKDDEANPLVSVLRLSGVTRVTEGLLYVRNRIYYRVFDREWVLANLPDAEVLRQRAAYRRGMLRTAAVAALIIVAIGGLAFTAFRQRNRALQSEQTNRQLLYTAHMNLAAQDWESGSVGRMRELLDAHIPAKGQSDERGFEWFYLWRLANANVQKLKSEGKFRTTNFSPDNKLMAAVEESNDITIWETSTWQKIKTLSGNKTDFLGVRFSPDNQKLVTRDVSGNVKFWNLATGQEIKTNDAIYVNTLNHVFSPDGAVLAVGYLNGTIKFWDTNSWQEKLLINAHQALESRNIAYLIDFSPNSKYLASRATDGVLRIWDAATGKEMKSFKVRKDFGQFIRFSPDSRSLLYVDKDVYLRDVATGKELLTIKNESCNCYRFTFSPDGQMVASLGSDNVVKVWETKTGRELFAFKGIIDPVSYAIFVQDGKKLMMIDKNANVLMWDLITKPKQDQLIVNEKAVNLGVFSPDGKMFASEEFGTKARIWDTLTGQELFALNAFDNDEHGAGMMAFASDGKQLVTSDQGRRIKIWDIATQRLVREFQTNVTSQSWTAGISLDGLRVITASTSNSFAERTIQVWDVNTGREMFSIKMASRGPVFGTVSTDGSMIAFALWEKISLCDGKTGRELRAFTEASHFSWATFSLDGEKLAAGTENGDVILYEVKTGRKISSVKGHASFVTFLAFSPDGKRLATASWDRKIKLWDANNGQELLTLPGHTNYVWSVAFSPDGKTLLSTSMDKSIRLWRAATEAEVLARRGQ